MKSLKLSFFLGEFGSPLDRKLFWSWLGKIRSVKKAGTEAVTKELFLLILFFDKGQLASKACLHELFGLFERYCIDKSQLILLKNKANADWFEGQRWSERVDSLQSVEDFYKKLQLSRVSGLLKV